MGFYMCTEYLRSRNIRKEAREEEIKKTAIS